MLEFDEPNAIGPVELSLAEKVPLPMYKSEVWLLTLLLPLPEVGPTTELLAHVY